MSDGETTRPVKTLNEVWRIYVRLFLDPIAAEQIQRQETRRAFYAGAQAVVSILTGNLSDNLEPTAADFALMDGIAKELELFNIAVQQRRA